MTTLILRNTIKIEVDLRKFTNRNTCDFQATTWQTFLDVGKFGNSFLFRRINID